MTYENISAKNLLPSNASYLPQVDCLLDELINTYGYSSSWLKTRCSIEEADDLLYVQLKTEHGIVFILGLIFKTERNIDDILNNINMYVERYAYCSSFFLQTNNNLLFLKKNMKNGNIEQSNGMEIYKAPNSSLKFTNSPVTNSTALIEKFENIFFEAHSFIRDIDGFHPDEALDELCKIVYTKLYDEEQNSETGNYEFQRILYGNNEECASSVRAMYVAANEYDKRVYSLRIPGYKRSRGVFDDNIKLSSAALVKVVETFEPFNFLESNIDLKGRAFQNIFKPATRSAMGQYFTPSNVIEFMVDAIKPSHTDIIIDPFCGSAHFLVECIKFVKANCKNKKQTDDFVFHKLHGIEKSERMVRIAMTDMRLHGDGHSNIRCTDALLPFSNYFDIEKESFDIVLTNPPFGSILTKDSFNHLGEFELNKNRSQVPLEILGLERSVQLLRASGKIAIVLPESVFVNKSYQYVREWLANMLKIRAIISLPIETFGPFGANIKTSLLFGSKYKFGEIDKEYNIFTGIIENIGYDARGRIKENPDWQQLLTEFSAFLSKEGW